MNTLEERGFKLQANVEFAGFLRLRTRKASGIITQDTGWFPNLITDWGLNQKGVGDKQGDSSFGSLTEHCHVGNAASPTAPAVTDTQLNSWLAAHDDSLTSTDGAQASPPYYGWLRRGYRFNQGTAAGNISEVGIGDSDEPSDNLWSRALVVDGGGTPTVVTVLSDEFLEVFYELRSYPVLDDQLMVVSDGPATYDVIVRPAEVTNNWWSRYVGARMDAAAEHNVSLCRFYSGDIGTIFQTPDGSNTNNFEHSTTNLPYSNNSLTKTANINLNLDGGNWPGGVRSLVFGGPTLGVYQAQFDPAIPKDDTKVLQVGVSIGWARASI